MSKSKYKSDTPYLDKTIKTYIKNAQKIYPGLKFGSSWAMYSGDQPRSCELELDFSSGIIKDTEYEIKEKVDLIHYTSNLQNAIEILNSGNIRLSNLLTLNDPQEVSFMINHLDIKNSELSIKDFKSTFFIASFCKVLNKEKPDDFAMWRAYGNDGVGVAIVFEVMNFGENWHNFMLSQVQYGVNNNSVNKFKDYMKFHESFQKSHNYPIQNILVTPSSLTAFHKNDIWEYEKEVRLLTYNDYDEYTLKNTDYHVCDLKHSLSKNNIKYSYVELPLYGGEEYRRIVKLGYKENLNHLMPILKVKEIILGYRIVEESYSDAFSVIDYLSGEYGYQILVNATHLKKYMI